MSNYTQRLNIEGITKEQLRSLENWFSLRFPNSDFEEFIIKLGGVQN